MTAVPAMKLACPFGCGYQVAFSRTQTWTAPDGTAAEFVICRCGRCGTRVLVEPSHRAVRDAGARLSAAAAIRKMGGD